MRDGGSAAEGARALGRAISVTAAIGELRDINAPSGHPALGGSA
jgi:hypothetical protein